MEKVLIYVGAHRGWTLKAMLPRFDRAFAFEPQPDCLRELAATFAGARNLEILPAVVSDRPGSAVFHVYGATGGSSSLGAMTQASADVVIPLGADVAFQGDLNVEGVFLPDFCRQRGIEAIDMLVTDAQGMDLTILKTMRPFLERRALRAIQAEVDKDGLPAYRGLENSRSAWIEFFRSFPGYRVTHGPINGWDDPGEIQADIAWELAAV